MTRVVRLLILSWSYTQTFQGCETHTWASFDSETSSPLLGLAEHASFLARQRSNVRPTIDFRAGPLLPTSPPINDLESECCYAPTVDARVHSSQFTEQYEQPTNTFIQNTHFIS
jgi:hypothetical protein